jgi:thiamine biosynthesis lipoprotein
VSTGPGIERRPGGLIAASFAAMAGPCEVLLETADDALARRLGELAAAEALRIEGKFSRYRDDSVVSRLNASGGTPMVVDEETARLLDYAQQCHALSAGRFDITSGVLRRLWKFDGHDRLPTPAEVAAVLPQVGFQRLTWRRPQLTLPAGMEIDFGGLGKEYAVDRVFTLLRERFDGALLVNFGGDLRASPAPAAGPWRVGVERPGLAREARLLLEVEQGALATSGTTHRFFIVDGVRYGHILDPRTGFPVEQAPLSVTVAAATCSEAGTFSTFAMLHGAGAERFLEAEGLKYWCLR